MLAVVGLLALTISAGTPAVSGGVAGLAPFPSVQAYDAGSGGVWGSEEGEVWQLLDPDFKLSYGNRSFWGSELNTRLAAAGFHSDSGSLYGSRTRHAVFALQKHYALPVTGRFVFDMWHLLDSEIRLPNRVEPTRVEIDLRRQLLYVVKNTEVVLILPISSGNGEEYLDQNGTVTKAITPEGKFRFGRRIRGWRESYLGWMYNPHYFFGGYAIHGSMSVPNYPASHGCIRLTLWDMDLIKTKIDLGWVVYVYGKRTAPPPAYVAPISRCAAQSPYFPECTAV